MLQLTITQAVPLIQALLDQNEPVMLWGSPGIGKSDLLRQIAKLRGSRLVDGFRASSMDQVDINGVPNVVDGRTVWNPPKDLPDDENCMIFFDEINTGSGPTMASLMRIILERKSGSYVMPASARIVAAGNLVTDRASANKMPTALADRFFHIHLIPDFEAWKIWSIGNGIVPELIAFLAWCESRENSLLHVMPEPGTNEVSFPTCRGWEKVSRVMEKTPALAFQIAAAKVGEPAAVELRAFLQVYKDLPKIADIIKSPMTAKVPREISAQFAVTQALAKAATADNFAAIIAYLSRNEPGEFTVELSVLGVTDAIRRDPDLKQAPGFTKWALDNQTVII